MASKPLTKDAQPQDPSRALETVLIEGDLSVLSAPERVHYYRAVCESLGLNPLTKPFEYLRLNQALVLYAKRDATDQLRKINKISVRLGEPRTIEGVYIVTAHATDAAGREDASTGAVYITGLSGEKLANAMLKSETKAKRRVTLSICGLGMMDETEIPIEAATRAATRPTIARKPADDLEDFAGEHPAPPGTTDDGGDSGTRRDPDVDAETGEIIDGDERPYAIPLAVADGVTDWAAFCAAMKAAMNGAEDEDMLLQIMEQNKDAMMTLSGGGKGGRAAADRLRAVFNGQQIELRRRAAVTAND